MMNDDMTLARDYAASQSEPAFAMLVGRHISLVHSAALRQVGDGHLAQEITQAVFIILARKAGSLGTNTILSAWLYRTTRYVASDALRTRRRRAQREREAYMQSTSTEPQASVWADLAPLLDEAMAGIGELERSALVLRFFENKSAPEIAAALNVSEDAAQKRVTRALEKLRRFFSKRGVSSTAAVIAWAMSANAVQVAPVGLAKSVAAVAAAKGAGASSSTLTLIKGALRIMAWTKAKTGVVAAAIVILVAGMAAVHELNGPLGESNHSARARADQAKNLDLALKLFADAHGGQLPDSLEQLQSDASVDRVLFSGISVSNWEIVSKGDWQNIANRSQTILLREKESRQASRGNFVRVYAFADGHSALVSSPDADFTAVEKQQGFLVYSAQK
jgi:RNA polymerase sigma factor (sigma-70 family)